MKFGKTAILLAAALALPVTAAAQTPRQAAFTVERAGAGQPMILIPGLLSSGEVWKQTVERYKGRYDMHVLTLAGFGGVPALPDSAFLPTVRDALVRYIRDNRLEKPILVGHSLGGFMAFWVAATAPELVGPVIAVDGVPYLMALGDSTMTPARAAPQALAIKQMYAGLSQEQLAAQTRMTLTAMMKDSANRVMGEGWARASSPVTAGKAVAEMLTTDIRGDVGRIQTPVLLFMAGNGMTAEQQVAAQRAYEAQIRGVRNGRVAVAGNARHFIMLDDPAFFYTTIDSFLRAR